MTSLRFKKLPISVFSIVLTFQKCHGSSNACPVKRSFFSSLVLSKPTPCFVTLFPSITNSHPNTSKTSTNIFVAPFPPHGRVHCRYVWSNSAPGSDVHSERCGTPLKRLSNTASHETLEMNGSVYVFGKHSENGFAVAGAHIPCNLSPEKDPEDKSWRWILRNLWWTQRFFKIKIVIILIDTACWYIQILSKSDSPALLLIGFFLIY